MSSPVACCAFSLVETPAGEIQIFPAGDFSVPDGAMMGTGPWRLNAAAASALISSDTPRKRDMVIDYEHQSLLSRTNGQPAPAAGWIKPGALTWREDGLYASAAWSAKAKAMIAEGEYKYISPVFRYDEQTGHPTKLFNVALTNTPAIDGMRAVTAAASSFFQPSEQPTMIPTLKTLLGIDSDAPTDAETEAACAALTAKLADAETKIAAAMAKTAPDPSKFVPLEVMAALQADLAALRSEINEKDVVDIVGKALSDGKLLPAQEAWARDLGKSNRAALVAYLDTAPAIAALHSSQTGGKPATGSDPNMSFDDRIKAEWDGSAALRGEFKRIESFKAFRAGEEDGTVVMFKAGNT